MSVKSKTEELLRRCGMRATRGRIALLDALQSAHGPVSAENLHVQVPSVDLVTVYRTLQSLADASLVREVRFKDASVRYELTDEGAHHHHLVCTTCGVVDELPQCDLRSIESGVLRRSRIFASIDEHALEFFGTCVSCTKR